MKLQSLNYLIVIVGVAAVVKAADQIKVFTDCSITCIEDTVSNSGDGGAETKACDVELMAGFKKCITENQCNDKDQVLAELEKDCNKMNPKFRRKLLRV